MRFVDIPDLVKDQILDLLTTEALINLRLVSHYCNQLVLNYKGLKGKLKKIEIRLENDQKVSEFNKFVNCLPFSKFYIKLLAYSPALEEFRAIKANLVVTLRVGNVVTSRESRHSEFPTKFLDSLPSLKHLKWYEFRDFKAPKVCLKNLESFECWKRLSSDWCAELSKNLNVRKLTIAFYDPKHDLEDEESAYLKFGEIESPLGREIINLLRNKLQNNDTVPLDLEFFPNLKFEYFFEPISQVVEFWNLVLKLEGKVRLHQVHAEYITELTTRDLNLTSDQINSILHSIKSVESTSEELFLFNLSNVDYLFTEEIPTLKNWKSYQNYRHVPLQNLKQLCISVYGEYSSENEHSLQNFSDLMFAKRDSVTSLDLEIASGDQYKLFFNPNCVKNFPNLKRLVLECAYFDKDDYFDLFDIIVPWTQLKELLLTYFFYIVDEFFYGRDGDKDNPVFLRMKHLNRLEFYARDGIGLTDAPFQNVISKMPLRVFELRDLHPLRSSYDDPRYISLAERLPKLSSEAITSLLDGRFGEIIQMFKMSVQVHKSIDEERFSIACKEIKERSNRNRCLAHPDFRV